MPYNRQIKLFQNLLLLTIFLGIIFAISSNDLAFASVYPSKVTDTLLNRAPGGQWVTELFNLSKMLMNISAVLILVFIAFANILHINIETYSVKKVLWPAVIALVFANFALPLIGLLSAIVDTLQDQVSIFEPYTLTESWDFFFKNLTTKQTIGSFAVAGIVASIITGGVAGSLSFFLAIALLLIPIIIVILLGFILALRPYVVFLAAGLSPLAIACYILPQTQSYFEKWVKIVIVWTTLPLVVCAILHLSDRIPVITSIYGSVSLEGIIGFFLPIGIKAGLLLLAIRYPFMIEKDISGLAHIAGKHAGNAAIWGGARLGNTIFKRSKAKQMEQNQVKANAIKSYMDKNNLTSEIKDDPIRYAEWKKNQKDYVDSEMREFTQNRDRGVKVLWHNPKFLETISGIPSFPLAAIEGIQMKKDYDRKEASKSAQKALYRGASSDINKYLKKSLSTPGGNSVFAPLKYELGGALTIGLDPRHIRGAFGNLKYFEAIAKDDLAGNLSPDQIADHMDSEKLTNAFVKALRKEKRFSDMEDGDVKDRAILQELDKRMQDLYIAQENVGTWASQGWIQEGMIDGGLNDADIAKLVVGYGRIQEQSLRQSSYGQGSISREIARRIAQVSTYGQATETEGEFKDRLLEQGYTEEEINKRMKEVGKTDRTDTEGESKIDLLENSGNEVQQKQTEALLEAIHSQTSLLESGISVEQIDSAVKLADKTNLGPDHISILDSQIDSLTQSIAGTLRDSGMDEDQLEKLSGGLKSGIAGVTPELSAKISSNPQAQEMFGKLQSAHMAKLAISANSDSAKQIDRISMEIMPKIAENPGLQTELKNACQDIIGAEFGVKISPEKIKNSRQIIGQNVSGSPRTKSGDFEIDALKAMSVVKALEVSYTEIPRPASDQPTGAPATPTKPTQETTSQPNNNFTGG